MVLSISVPAPAGVGIELCSGLRQQRARLVAEAGEVRLQAVVGLADDAQQGAQHLQQRLRSARRRIRPGAAAPSAGSPAMLRYCAS